MELFHASPWVPVEWIKAHGIEPRGLWYSDELNLGATRSSAGACAFAQAVVRFAETHPEKAVLLTTHCDQLRRGFDTFAGSQPDRAFLFNLPATWQSPVAERLYDCELERLSRFLLALGGHLPTAGGSGVRRLTPTPRRGGHCSRKRRFARRAPTPRRSLGFIGTARPSAMAKRVRHPIRPSRWRCLAALCRAPNGR